MWDVYISIFMDQPMQSVTLNFAFAFACCNVLMIFEENRLFICWSIFSHLHFTEFLLYPHNILLNFVRNIDIFRNSDNSSPFVIFKFVLKWNEMKSFAFVSMKQRHHHYIQYNTILYLCDVVLFLFLNDYRELINFNKYSLI